MAVGQELVDLAVDTWGRLDIVINNAGIGRPKMVFNLAEDEWDDVVRVHLKGTFAVSRPACRWWRAQAKQHGSTYGRLINTSTGLLVYGGAGQSNYVAAKGGVGAFTDAVATEMAPYGVTVNALMPAAMTRLAAVGWRMRRHEARSTCRSTLRIRCTSPSWPAYLASPAAGWVSGQTFQIRGVHHRARRRLAGARTRSSAPTARSPPPISPSSCRACSAPAASARTRRPALARAIRQRTRSREPPRDGCRGPRCAWSALAALPARHPAAHEPGELPHCLRYMSPSSCRPATRCTRARCR